MACINRIASDQIGLEVGFGNILPMSNYNAWYIEKTSNLIRDTCFMIKHVKEFKHDLEDPPNLDIRDVLYQMLSNEIKLYFDAAKEIRGEAVSRSWSPEIVN